MAEHDEPPAEGGKVIPFGRTRRARPARAERPKPPTLYATRAHAERDQALEAFRTSLAAFEKLDIEGELARVDAAIAEGQPGAEEAKAGVRNARACRSFARGDIDAAEREWAEILEAHPQYIDARLTRATFHRHQASYAKAIEDLDRAAEVDPQNAVVYQTRGDCYDSLGDPDRAMANYRRALQLDPTSVQTHTSVGRILSAAQNHKGAVRAFTRALKYAPGSANLYGMRATEHELDGDIEAALADYDKSLALFPPQIDLWVARGSCRHQLGMMDLALEDFTRAVDARPDDPYALRRRGELHLDAGRLEAAMTDLTRAIELAPDHAIGVWLRGVARQQLDDFDGALADFTLAIELDPSSANFLLARANLHARLSRGRECLEDLGRVLAQRPADVDTLAAHARLAAHLGDPARAEADLDRAITFAPDRAELFHARAELARGRRDFPAAFAAEERAAALAPTNADYRSWLGRYRHLADDTPASREAALRDLTAAIDLAPSEAMPLVHRAAFLASIERHAEAVEDYGRALALVPSVAWYWYQAALARRHADLSEEGLRKSLEEIDRALAIGIPDEHLPDVHWWRADTLEELEDYEGALAALTQVIALVPERADVYEDRARVRELLGDDEGSEEDFARAEELYERESVAMGNPATVGKPEGVPQTPPVGGDGETVAAGEPPAGGAAEMPDLIGRLAPLFEAEAESDGPRSEPPF